MTETINWSVADTGFVLIFDSGHEANGFKSPFMNFLISSGVIMS